MKKKITERQQEIFDFICSFVQERGYPPTLREIGKVVGIGSTNGVVGHLDALEKKNFIIRRQDISRGIEILNVPKVIHTDMGVSHIPIINKLEAGKPMFDPENIERTLAVDDSFILSKKVFAIKVHDDSMNGMGIIKGDYVIVRCQNIGEPGDIVIFTLDNVVKIRQYDEKGYKAILTPKNKSYKKMKIWKNSPDLQIAGKVIGLIRSYKESFDRYYLMS